MKTIAKGIIGIILLSISNSRNENITAKKSEGW